MQFILILLTSLIFIGCNSSGGGSASDDSIVNKNSISGSYFMAGESISTDGYYYVGVNFLKENKISFVEFYWPNLNNLSLAYIRKKEGSYNKNGNTYDIQWNYETCSPEESILANVSSNDPSDRIFVTIENVTVQFLQADKWIEDNGYANSAFNMIEDTDCNQFPQ